MINIKDINILHKTLDKFLLTKNIRVSNLDRTPVSYILDPYYHNNYEIASVKNKIINNIQKNVKQFNSLVNEGNDLTEKHCLALLKYFNRERLELDLIDELILVADVDEDVILSVVNNFHIIMSLIKPKLYSKIPKFSLVVKENESTSFAMPEKNLIVLNYRETNKINLVSELVHEFIHFMEYHNKTLKDKAYKFLNDNSKGEYENIRVLSQKYKKNNLANLNSYVFAGKFENLYAGFVYDINGIYMTEFVSTNFQYFITNPVTFIYKYPEIYKYLKLNLLF